MRSRSLTLCAVAVMCTVAVAVVAINADDALENPEPLQRITSIPAKADADKADRAVVIVYPVADLPVWSQGGKKGASTTFDAKVLKALITSTVDTESWKDDGGSINPHESTAALVICTSRANHQLIADLLEQLRGRDPHEAKVKLSESPVGSDKRLEKWHTVPASERADRTESSLKLEQPVFDQSTSQAKEYDHQLLLVIDAISKSERLATTNVQAATKAIETAHQTLQKSTLARPLKSRLEDRLDEHQQGLERRHNRDQHFDELGRLFNFELEAPILPSQPKLRPLTPPSTFHRHQPFGVDSWTKDELFQTRPSQVYLDQEALADKLTCGRSWPKTGRLHKQQGPKSGWPTMPLYLAE